METKRYTGYPDLFHTQYQLKDKPGKVEYVQQPSKKNKYLESPLNK